MAVLYQGGNDFTVAGAFQPMMRTLERNYLFEQEQRQQQRKEREALNNQVQKDLAKVNANGIWEADLPEFNQQYSALKDTYYKMVTTRDPNEQRKLAMDINSQLGQISSFVDASSKFNQSYGKSLNGLGNLAGKGRLDDARKHLLSLREKPSSQAGREALDLSGYLYTYDPTKVDSAISKVATTRLRTAPEQRQLTGTFSTSGGRRYDDYTLSKSVGEEVIIEEVSRLARGGSRDVQNYVQEIMDTQGVDFNTAVGMVAEEFRPKFESVTTERLSAERPTPRITNVNVNMPSEAVAENYYKVGLGNFTSNESKTYKEDVPLIGTRDVYTSNGQKVTVNFQDATFKGQALMRLPVNAQGDPVPTDNNGNPRSPNQVAGYREFVAGTLPQQDVIDFYGAMSPQAQALSRDQALLPMSQIQWIGQSKARRQDLRGVQQESSTAPVNRNNQNNPVPSATKPKFN